MKHLKLFEHNNYYQNITTYEFWDYNTHRVWMELRYINQLKKIYHNLDIGYDMGVRYVVIIPDSLSIITITIFQIEDDYFLVRVSFMMPKEAQFYKCDQFDGLLNLLEFINYSI